MKLYVSPSGVEHVEKTDYDALAAQLADQVRVTEEHQRLRYQCETENTRLAAELGELQAAFHDTCQRLCDEQAKSDALAAALERYAQNPPWDRVLALEAALRPLATAAKSWHDFHHKTQIQCDWICEVLPAALAVLAEKETSSPELKQAPMPCPGFDSGACVPGAYCGRRVGYAYPCPGQPSIRSVTVPETKGEVGG